MSHVQPVGEHITDGLSAENKILVKKLESKLMEHPARIAELGKFICQKMQQEGVVDFCTLSDETKLQAVLEYVVIGFTSGVFTKEDFKPFM